jgi:hypothetical protein
MEESVLSIEPSLDKTVTVNVEGWKPNLTILYSVDIHAGVSYLCWKIQNTEQIFRILATTVYEKHGLNFSEHFGLTLKTFREDYKEWETQSFTEEWMKRYYRIFHQLII